MSQSKSEILLDFIKTLVDDQDYQNNVGYKYLMTALGKEEYNKDEIRIMEGVYWFYIGNRILNRTFTTLQKIEVIKPVRSMDTIEIIKEDTGILTNLESRIGRDIKTTPNPSILNDLIFIRALSFSEKQYYDDSFGNISRTVKRDTYNFKTYTDDLITNMEQYSRKDKIDKVVQERKKTMADNEILIKEIGKLKKINNDSSTKHKIEKKILEDNYNDKEKKIIEDYNKKITEKFLSTIEKIKNALAINIPNFGIGTTNEEKITKKLLEEIELRTLNNDSQELFYKLLTKVYEDKKLIDEINDEFSRSIETINSLDEYFKLRDDKISRLEGFINDLEEQFKEDDEITQQPIEDDKKTNELDKINQDKLDSIDSLQKIESDLQDRINKLRDEIRRLTNEKNDLAKEKETAIKKLQEILTL